MLPFCLIPKWREQLFRYIVQRTSEKEFVDRCAVIKRNLLAASAKFVMALPVEFLAFWFFLIVPKGIFIFFVIDYIIGIIRFIFIGENRLCQTIIVS